MHVRNGTGFALECAKLIQCNKRLKNRITRSAFRGFCMHVCEFEAGRERDRHNTSSG